MANLFERLLDATARRVVHPAVVGATDAFLLGDAIGQADAPVRARALQQPEAALEVSEQDEVLPEEPHLLRPAAMGARRLLDVEVVRRGDRVPVPTEKLPHRSAPSGLCQGCVVLSAQHLATSGECDGDEQ